MITLMGILALIAAVLCQKPGDPRGISGAAITSLGGVPRPTYRPSTPKPTTYPPFPHTYRPTPIPIQSSSYTAQNNHISKGNLQETYPGNNYEYRYKTDNGIEVKEKGHFHQLGRDSLKKEVIGSYQWISPEGELISVNYVADENGFRPVVKRTIRSGNIQNTAK